LQGVRAYDPNMNQWTTPDAYSGRVNDPMSQHPYMWNDNNPVQYADPSGYDTIDMYARDPRPNQDFGALIHLFIEVHDDHGNVKARYSFGPANDADPFHSKLVWRRDYDVDHAKGAGTYGPPVVIGSCNGTCTYTNGGFNEAGLKSDAEAINGMGLDYNAYNSSNAGAYSLCAHNGGRSCSSTNAGFRYAPGDGHNLFDPDFGGRGVQPQPDTPDQHAQPLFHDAEE
ncbi:MAG TPA: hypothetical protein VNF68_03915, partial [Candidatus Baltobacteraceae bacterium]|nr:hypothetical protein [Candidatus Baltobacteraceae bacterium]